MFLILMTFWIILCIADGDIEDESGITSIDREELTDDEVSIGDIVDEVENDFASSGISLSEMVVVESV